MFKLGEKGREGGRREFFGVDHQHIWRISVHLPIYNVSNGERLGIWLLNVSVVQKEVF